MAQVANTPLKMTSVKELPVLDPEKNENNCLTLMESVALCMVLILMLIRYQTIQT